ncbi:MAG: sigma-70 family RNA polymerase sigma factor [Acidobacteria bacterium]|nr:sigma-70 family RNA polymerase sigma factor [Acidobacteriota bacterium]
MSVNAATAKTPQGFAPHDQSWSELIRRMAIGDRASLAELYDQSNRLVFGLALHIVKESRVAEEITLNAYQQAWQQAHAFDTERAKASCWILTIARQQAITWLRAASPAASVQPLSDQITLDDFDDGPSEIFMFDEQRQRIRRALPQLDQTQRALIECAFFEGLTHHEIAIKYSMSPSTVQRGIGSGMRKLRELLFNEEEFASSERRAESH